jgi:hypothetical protein
MPCDRRTVDAAARSSYAECPDARRPKEASISMQTHFGDGPLAPHAETGTDRRVSRGCMPGAQAERVKRLALASPSSPGAGGGRGRVGKARIRGDERAIGAATVTGYRKRLQSRSPTVKISPERTFLPRSRRAKFNPRTTTSGLQQLVLRAVSGDVGEHSEGNPAITR